MPKIDVLNRSIVFDNPIQHLRSRHGYFPGIEQLQNKELIALFAIGEAFESVDLTTYISRSIDNGKTWQLQGPLCSRDAFDSPVSIFLKPTVLNDGKIIAMGYIFYRINPEYAIGNPETNGILSGDIITSFSNDGGRTWSVPGVVPRTRAELIEVSGPCIQLKNGDLLASGGLFSMWDGTLPSGQLGILLRSADGGRSWDDSVSFFETIDRSVTPFESRLCEMSDGNIVALAWAYNQYKGISLNNHFTISHDNGYTWSQPIDTHIEAQASNLIWLGGSQLLTVHAHRGEADTGLFVRLVDLSYEKWQVIYEKKVWGGDSSDVAGRLSSVFKTLKFGQPSLLRLSESEFLLTHWSIEDGQGRILLHRLQVTL